MGRAWCGSGDHRSTISTISEKRLRTGACKDPRMLHGLIDMLVPSGSKRRARPLLERGEVLVGRIDAIRVLKRGESPDDWEYGVQAAGTRFGMRQWLEPARGRASLGAEVVLRRLEDRALIDWPATFERLGLGTTAHSVDLWKPLREPPPPGLTGVTEAELARRREVPPPSD
jgi:hypothetical protein